MRCEPARATRSSIVSAKELADVQRRFAPTTVIGGLLRSATRRPGGRQAINPVATAPVSMVGTKARMFPSLSRHFESSKIPKRTGRSSLPGGNE